jgi:hypothetical protein
MTKHLVILALAAGTFAAAPHALKAADDPCPRGNETLHGTYMVHAAGTIVGLGPIASNGIVTFDGKGNIVNTFSASLNGEIQRGVTWTGIYSLNPDCTGTQILNGSHIDFVVMPDGSTFSAIATDPGFVFSGSATRFKE